MEITEVLPKDAIPSIDDPTFGTSYFGSAEDRLIVVDGCPPRGYPFRILQYHEIVNDVSPEGLDPHRICVTWCPLCGSAVVYDRVVDGRALTFGVSGKLADDDLVMYDRETGSEWQQSSGRCIAGELAGAALRMHPAAVVTWQTFQEEHPDGVVLQPPETDSEVASDSAEPAPVDYTEDPYAEYFAAEGFGLAAHRGGEGRSWCRDDLAPKTVVLGIERGDEALAFPRPTVESVGGIGRATVGDVEVIVFTTEGELQAFADPGVTFHRSGDTIRGDGTVWDPATGRATDGRQLSRLPAKRIFAFAWRDVHGPDAFYDPAADEVDRSGGTDDR